MDFVDNLTGTGGKHYETEVGARQTNEGIQRMKGVRSDNTASGAVGQENIGAQPTTTAPPPLPERRQDVGVAPTTDSSDKTDIGVAPASTSTGTSHV